MDYINALEIALGKVAIKEYLPLQDGDVLATHADTTRLDKYVQFKPNTPIQDGVNEFVKWYLEFKKSFG
jgi:UDP-glucuronate 4-epimerase